VRGSGVLGGLEMKTLRAFPRRTNATPDDDNVRIGMPGLFDECDKALIKEWMTTILKSTQTTEK
jgi:hypothetical protein